MTQPATMPRLNTTGDGWVIYPSQRFYNAERSNWGTVIRPAGPEDGEYLADHRYWLVVMDNSRATGGHWTTGAHMLCHVPDVAYWDRHVAPDAENIADYHERGFTSEDRMRKDYLWMNHERARIRRAIKDAWQTADIHRYWKKTTIPDLTSRMEWIELVYRVRGLPLPK